MNVKAVKIGATYKVENIAMGLRGEKGEPFRYEDFTPEQLESLKGEKGDKGDKPVSGVDYWTESDKNQIKYELQTYVDGQGYEKTTDVNSKLDGKVNVEAGKELISTSELTRLASLENYDDTEIRGEIGTIDGKADEAKTTADRAVAIAQGRATGYVFDTVDAMNAWLADPTHTAILNIGDPLYIRAQGVPDYWWDGTQAIQLEAREIDLTGYVKNTDYASPSSAGIVRTSTFYGSAVASSYLVGVSKSASDYADANKTSATCLISKGTLEAIKDSLVRGVGDSYYPSKTALSEGLAGKVNKTESVNLTAQFDDGTTKTFAIYGSEA